MAAAASNMLIVGYAGGWGRVGGGRVVVLCVVGAGWVVCAGWVMGTV